MGLKPMGTDSEPKQRCGSSPRIISGLALCHLELSLMQTVLTSTKFRVIGHASNARKGLWQFMEID